MGAIPKKKKPTPECTRAAKGERKVAKLKYTTDLPRKMYTYFCSYEGVGGVPSFEKFARSIGTTLAILLSFRGHKKFDEAYAECNEIRRDYLIDGALAKRLDASFTKYLLDSEGGAVRDGEGDFSITLQVLE